ncbi:MAG: peptide chain release factor N(5)-glutamine methyltransferase [Candidatus Moranbacteria bacterium]|nr:peptide chain release factor N(5)-glutamine methyltransferase [Candidatus Moranbacteria bacterium]
MNSKELLLKAKNILIKKRIESLSFDSELLLSFILGVSREYILTHPEYEVSSEKERKFLELIKRRSRGEPVAYLIGRKEFCGLNFQVDQNVLIPRPETELMVEKVLKLVEKEKSKEKVAFIDIGTGSGCIIISLAQKLKNYSKENLFYASDISLKALNVAKKNAKKHKAENIKFLHGNLLEPFFNNKSLLKADKIIITANLPYLSQEIYQSAPKDVRDFEPKMALEAGDDGLDLYRELFEQMQSENLNKKTTSLFLEISPEQKEKTEDLVNKKLSNAKIAHYKDLANKSRMIEINMKTFSSIVL